VSFSNKDISDYYDQTEVHYRQLWKLNEHKAIHYGIWEKNTKTFGEALQNTNKIIVERTGLHKQHHVLDAGCGVGGTAIFLAGKTGCSVHGITLSEKQVQSAQANAKAKGLEGKVQFSAQDYTQTNFVDQSFDIITAVESVSSAPDKNAFIKEAYRLLKPGGQLILFDYFKPSNHIPPEGEKLLQQWLSKWAIEGITSYSNFTEHLGKAGFSDIQTEDISEKIYPSAKRMYKAYQFGRFSSGTYNLLFKASRFAREHYKCGKYQYKALKGGHWKYFIFEAKKS
jgi:tocopherol O-methyltransferase